MKRFFPAVALVLFILTSIQFLPAIAGTYAKKANINPGDISIVRDKWGIPHIYAPKDKEVLYGLAWANCEDNFKVVQENYLAVRKMQGRVKGKSGAIMDMIYHITNADSTVERMFEKHVSEDFKDMLQAYAAGINDYAEKYPNEVLIKKLFPLTAKDLVKSSILGLTFMTNVHYDLRRIFDGTIAALDPGAMARGSNGMAVSSLKTSDGKTYLAINSHQPLEGAYSWYEAHVHSGEGWNMLGGTFPGGAGVFLGVNENLGWGHTVNYADYADVYKLKMHPKKKNMYRFDGEWHKLKKRPAKIKVKILGFLRMPVKKMFYESKYGTTIKKDGNYYSIRFPANMGVGALEQWYMMNKARNFNEFMDALKMEALPGLNIIYADREDNIYFLNNGHYPYRNTAYDWETVLPGDTSATLWAAGKFYPLDSLPQILNPECGYIFNMNNTPFNATCAEENLNPDDYPATQGHLRENTARSVRYSELIKSYDKMSYDDFKKLKYDMKYEKPFYTRSLENMEVMFNLDAEKYPDIAESIKIINIWNRSTDVNNEHASIAALAIQYLLKELSRIGRYEMNNTLPELVYAEAIRFAQAHLKKYFGKLQVPLGELQVIVRGEKEIPVWGMPEVMTQMYTVPYKDGKYKAYAGESYIELAKFSSEGVEIETIHSFGASNNPESPHYDDQMEMFVNQQLKPMTLDKDKIFEEAVRIYTPE